MDSEKTSGKDDPLVYDEAHADDVHARWVQHQNRKWPSNEDDIPDSWYNEQCGQCRYYVPLKGRLGTDWGACSNPASNFDGKVMFEHDGCDHYSGASEWVSSYMYLLSKAEKST